MAAHPIAGRPVIEYVLRRVARVGAVETMVVVQPAASHALAGIDLASIGKAVHSFAFDPAAMRDPHQSARIAGRKWAMQSWRGGLGSATCYDELLPAGPLAAAMREHEADAALLLGADWVLVDPALCDAVIERHLWAPESMKMVFTQAPPGLAGIAMARDLVEHMADKRVGFGPMLGYLPSKPQADPIGLDVCVQVPPVVRSCVNRFAYDTPRSIAMIDQIARRAFSHFDSIDAVAACAFAAEADHSHDFLPRQITLELTPERSVRGPITPQHYVDLQRPPIELSAARRIVEQLGDAGDITLTLGGLGDALLHPDWLPVVEAARAAGVLGIAVETDMLVEPDALPALLGAPIDVLSVRLNADTAAMYERVMGADRFAQVTHHLQWLLTERHHRGALPEGDAGLPWIVPRLIKTADTLADMETFFDRWVHFSGHAVIEPAVTGRHHGMPLSPEQSPVLMAPPRRIGCRQIERRMTILSDGTVSLCDQDWLGGDIIGDTAITPLIDIWRGGRTRRESHATRRWNELPTCAGCHEWHRP
jgi:hypothetical protein